MVEGQAEETYVRDTLAMHLGQYGHIVDVRCVMTGRKRAHFFRGGLVSYQKAKMDLQFWMREDTSAEIPEYEGRKVTAGALVAGKIPISTVRDRCKHFHDWLSALEQSENVGNPSA